MIDFRVGSEAPVESPARDGVAGVEGTPRIVSVSDLHGYLGDARSALTAVGDAEGFDPVVEADGDGRLHWADNEYVLVFNGDLIDRGPDNEGVLALVERLSAQAPDGSVRLTLGNHEWGVMLQSLVEWDGWFSGGRSDAERARLCRAVADGDLVAAYEGYGVTYAHAGQPSEYRATALNDRFAEAAADLATAVGTPADAETQRSLVEAYGRVLGVGQGSGRGFGAGIAWLDFRYLPGDSPPQVVGHTRQDDPVRKGNVVCENLIRANLDRPGGEGVFVESPDRLVALRRTADGGVETEAFDVPDPEGEGEGKE